MEKFMGTVAYKHTHTQFPPTPPGGVSPLTGTGHAVVVQVVCRCTIGGLGLHNHHYQTLIPLGWGRSAAARHGGKKGLYAEWSVERAISPLCVWWWFS